MSPSKPRVLISVFFNAPLGGLQSHVRAQALAIRRAGWSCTVLCKAGPFANQLADDGLSVVRDDFSDREACVSRTLEAGPFDLVHAHPFASREIGLDVADRMGLPLLLTIHGMYADGLSAYASRVARVLCVSPAIRDWLVNRSPALAEKIWIMPNGVDTGLFRPGPPGRAERLADLGELGIGRPDPLQRQLLFVSRLDDDKRFILDVLQDTWQRQIETRSFDLRWFVAGDGQNRPAMEKAARGLNEAFGSELATFVGWQTEEQLARLYRAVDLCVAPGRSALDCLSCSRPVIAIGSKAYLGLMDQDGLLSGQYTNFGGFGGGAQDYPPGRMFADLEKLVYDDGKLDTLGALGRSFVAREHDQSLLDQRLMDLYGACLSDRVALQGSLPGDMVPVEIAGLAFADAQGPENLAQHWTMAVIPSGRMELDQQGHLSLDFQCRGEEKFYLTNGDLGFEKPGRGKGLWPVRPEAHYRLRAKLEVLNGQPQAKLWVIEYDESARLKSTIVDLRPGLMEIPFFTSAQAHSFRLAVRFSGVGSLRLAPVQLLGQDGNAGSVDSGAGSRC